MLARRTNGSDPIALLRNEMDRMTEGFLRNPWGAWNEAGLAKVEPWSPTLEVSENDTEIVVRAEVPGVDPKELKVTLEQGILTFEGEKRETQEHKDGDYVRTECRYGSFRRSVGLPEGVDAEKISAEHAHGVVTVRLPKTPAATPKRIDVKTA